MEVARTQIESSKEEEPSLVRPPGRIKTPPHFSAYFRYCPEVLAEALRTARAEVRSPPKSSSSSTSLNFDFGSQLAHTSNSIFGSSTDCHNRDGGSFDDLFTTATTGSNSTPRDEPFNLDSMFLGSGGDSLSPLVYDKPVYDDGVFDSVPGLQSTAQVNFDDVFVSPKTECGGFDDLLGGFGNGSGRNGSEKDDKASYDFDDLLAGFGRSRSPFSDRHAPDVGLSFEPTVSASKTTSTAAEDPFKVFESTSAPMDSSTSNFTDPLEEISKSATMAQPPKSSSNSTSLNFDFGSQSAHTSNSVFGSSTKHHNRDGGSFDDLFTTAAAGSNSKPCDAPFDLDFMYSGSCGNSSPSPIYDKPVYDDDVFDSVLGLKSTTKVNFVLPKTESGAFDDLLGGFGKGSCRKGSNIDENGGSDFDDLLAGFGRSSSLSNHSCALLEFKEAVPTSESSPIVIVSQAQIEVARKQIVESTKEEPSLVGPPGIIKTPPHLFVNFCYDQAKNDEAWLTALDEVRKQQLGQEKEWLEA